MHMLIFEQMRTLVLQCAGLSQKNDIQLLTSDITVRLGTVSVGAIGFMSIRNKYGRTLVNPNFCSVDTWS